MDQETYRKLTQKAAMASIAVALTLMLSKIVVWIISGSLVLLTSLMDSMFDILASITSFFILRHATKPADEDHTFGHGKIEHLGVLAQGLFISSSAIVIGIEAVKRIIQGDYNASHNGLVIGVSIFSIVVTLSLICYQKHIIKLTKSSAIAADSVHYQMDVYMNCVIILSALLSSFGVSYADPIFAVFIAIFIISKALGMLYQATQSLIDKSLPEEDLNKIAKVIESHPHVSGIHNLRSRASGITNYIEFHLELDDTMSFAQVHMVCDEIEVILNELFSPVEVLIHPEPVSVALKQESGEYEFQVDQELVDRITDSLKSTTTGEK